MCAYKWEQPRANHRHFCPVVNQRAPIRQAGCCAFAVIPVTWDPAEELARSPLAGIHRTDWRLTSW
jgi:hypothetical protein